MKVIITGDIHIGCSASNTFRLFDTLDILKQIGDYCVSKNINDLFIAGDLFDKRDGFTSICLYESYKAIEDLSKKVRIISVVGNHESPFKTFIDGQNNIRHLSQLAETFNDIRYGSVDFGQTTFWFLHWVEHVSDLKSCIDQMKKQFNPLHKNVLISHLHLVNFMNDNGTVSYNGINSALLSCFDRVFLGHLHTHQTNGRITYVGSPLELKSNENSSVHGFVVYDTESDTFEMIPTKYRRYITMNIKRVDKMSKKNIAFMKKNFPDNIVNVQIMEYLGSDWMRTIRSHIKEKFRPKLLKINCALPVSKKQERARRTSDGDLVINDLSSATRNWLSDSNIDKSRHDKIISMVCAIKDEIDGAVK